eukprot:5157134-Karenia_brevis.AAC.1
MGAVGNLSDAATAKASRYVKSKERYFSAGLRRSKLFLVFNHVEVIADSFALFVDCDLVHEVSDCPDVED